MRSSFAYLVVGALAYGTLAGVGCGGEVAPPPPPPPEELEVAGSYDLDSSVEVPPTVLASQPVVDTLDLLRLLKTDPAAAFFQLLDEAGVPLAGELVSVLPGAVKGQLNDAINDYLRARGVGASGGELDRILAIAERAFVTFRLDSRLDVPAGAKGTATGGAHGIQAVIFDVPGGVAIPVPRVLLDTVSPLPGSLDAAPTVMVNGAAPSAGDAAIVVGDHFFGLAYGEILFAALDGRPDGPSLRARLGQAFDCPGLGTAVASRCVLGLCIGHAAEVTAVCESALDVAVDKIHDQLAMANFEALRFSSGRAQLWDQAAAEARDGLVDRIAAGTWQATIDAGPGPRACRATFTGHRH
jgi:hypothetical protein